ncbi:hypothetical protein OHA71_10540 [Streptomyces sp. NBC_00444]|uniref:hypothetical protein n=1 Tax=Streptomyces sp. NBC_00444 TaxID=2975744 RepID=UPI002E222E56
MFAAAEALLRARQVYKAMDLEFAPNTINNTRLELKRLTERGMPAETEQACSRVRGRKPPCVAPTCPRVLDEAVNQT